ncbi:MAG: FAD-dependent oxidoreductase [Pseudomonadota bacterium]
MDELTFHFDGRSYSANRGDSIAAALSAAGVHTLGTRRSGRPRAAFCGMGVCHDCLVTVDSVRGERACMTRVRQGMTVQREDERSFADGTKAPRPATSEAINADLAIIGAGPAGLSAALGAADAGADVVVLDERGEAGGQYYKPRSEGHRGSTLLDRQHLRGKALRAKVSASGARFIAGQSVWFARRNEAGFEIRTLGQERAYRVQSRAVIIATGAYERPAMVPGWTLPGVMTIGSAQTLVRRYGVVPGKRILIAGHGPLGMQLASELADLNADMVALADRGRPAPGLALLSAALADPRLVADGAAYRLALMRARTPFLSGWELCRIEGEDRAEAAVLRQISTGKEKRFEVDCVVAGDGFAAQLELARLLDVPVKTDVTTGDVRPMRQADGTTPTPGVWIAGDAGGLGGAQIATRQGELSALSALQYLGIPSSADTKRAMRNLNWAQRFQSALWSMYRAPARGPICDQTILCRCEEVSAGTARAAIADGADDPAVLKRKTRIGMGRCQGRYCLPQALKLFDAAGIKADSSALFAPQIPARPTQLGALALEKPEWGGHREGAPAIRPDRAALAPMPVEAADLVIIGAGVTGVSAALYAARAGAKVVCVDRGRVNGEASGGNAGSLHLQLLSWDFGGKAVGDGSLQLQTLPLQQESIALWRELESELDVDFEMAVTGGLMVAEDTDQIRFLIAKVEAEARVGIHTEVIDGARVREIAPAVSDEIVAAAWCPDEGKIDPLVATPLLAKAARAAGAQIEEFAPVTGVARNGSGYVVDTPRGTIKAARVLIATGGWSCQLGSMLGAELPIRGAPLQMVVTAPSPPLVPCLLAHADRHLSMKQAASGSIIIGGAWPGNTNHQGCSEVLPDSLEGNLWVAARTVPDVANLQVIRSWAAMNIDIDGAPLLGSVPGFAGITVAATANGYTLGPLMGREAANIALSGRARQDLEGFSLDRFG